MGEVVGGESRGGAIGDLAAALEHDDARRHVDDFRHVVADQDHRRAAAMQLADEVEHLAALGDTQRGGGLVHDHEPRVPVERPGDRHRLSLPAGQPLDGAIGVADVDLEAREITGRRLAHRALVEDAHARHAAVG